MIVQTKNGKIKGFENKSIASGKKFNSFLGIPYAKPPVGDLRFAPPAPADSWNGVYDATFERSMCGHFYDVGIRGFTNLIGSENCLFLNIHTPQVNRNALRPVLFLIHGGGFFWGSGSQDYMGADYMIEHDVVVVTINYRLHILGFLNLQLTECPGNAGLKDQLMALKWVKENIKEFGGNPENITINGSSAGAVSVHMMMISPQTKGLFQKAIFQGGHSLCSFGLTRDPIRWAFEAGEKLGFQGDDRHELLKFFKSISMEKLVEVAHEIFLSGQSAYPAGRLHLTFGPTVESIKEGAFLPDFPENLIKHAEPVPCIVGYNEVEALFSFSILLKIAENENNPESFIKDIIKDNYKVNEKQLDEMENEIKLFYFQQQQYENRSKIETINSLLTDLIHLQFYESFEFISQSNVPAYVYYFTYFMEEHYYRKVFGSLNSSKRASHGEECILLYAPRIADPFPVLKGIDAKVQKNICTLFTNFIKNGDPSSNDFITKWKPCSNNEPCYLQIDDELNLKNGKINEKRIKFLKHLFRDVELTQ